MVTPDNKLIGILQILIGASLFGLIPILIRLGQNINTSNLLFFRVFFGAIFMYLIIKITKTELNPFKEEKLKLFLWALTFLFAAIFYFLSLKLIAIAPAVLLLYSQSITIILLSRFWLKEKINAYTIIALILSIIGVLLILLPSGFYFRGNSLGYIFGIGAAFFAGLNFILPKKYFQKYNTYSLTFYELLLLTPLLAIFVIASPPDFNFKNMTIFMALGLLGTALAFLLIYTGSRKVSGQYIGILQTTEALVPILLGIIFFSEIPPLTIFIGGVLLIGGDFLIAIKETKK